LSEQTLMNVPIDQLHPDPAQPRKSFDEEELAALADSMKKLGVITPLTVRKADDNEHYIVTAGGRRYAAAKLAGLTEVPVLVREEDTSLVTAMVENLVRQDLSPLEEGLAYQTLASQGHNAEQIGALVQRPKERVADRLELAALPDDAKAMILDGRMPLSAARTLVRFNEVDKEIATKIAGLLESDDLEVEDFERNPTWALKQLLGRMHSNRKLAKKIGWVGYPTGTDLPIDLAPVFLDKATVKKLKELQEAEPPVKLPDYATPPSPSIDDTQIDLARAYGCLVEFGQSHYGASWVTDLAWFQENILAGFPQQIEHHYNRYRTARKAPAAPKGDLSPAEQAAKDKQAEERAKQREQAAKERTKGEAWNLELGEVLYNRVTKVEPTVEQARLIARTCLEGHLTGQRGYDGAAQASGIAMYHRFMFEPPARSKKGEAKHLRKQEALDAALEAFEKELRRARSAGEVFAVLFRWIAAGMYVDVRGLPKVDVEGCSLGGLPFKDEWEKATKQALPKAFRDRLSRRR
jgi:ParB/RepB/Spo0J family partition protein